MLTGSKIRTERELGNISIEPFNESQLNPNSYNLRLHKNMKVYLPSPDAEVDDNDDGNFLVDIPIELDAKKDNPVKEIVIPKEGYVLQPGVLYIARTKEIVGSKEFVPCISGRSSIARLGIQVHVTAGFGDIGFQGTFTLEITVVHPVRVYPNMEICQLYFEPADGPTDMKYNGKYLNQLDATPSKMYQDFDK